MSGESWTTRIDNYDGPRGSDLLSKSFCPGTLYGGGRRLRNMVRANLRRFVRRDKAEGKKVKENFADDRRYEGPSRKELCRRGEKERDRKGTGAKNSYGRTRPFRFDFDRIAIYDLRTPVDDRSPMDRRSTTYSPSKVEEEPSSTRRDCHHFLSIGPRRSNEKSIKLIDGFTSRSRNRDLVGTTKFLSGMKRNFTDGERERRSKEVRNDRKTDNIDNGKGLQFVFDRSSCGNSNEILSNGRLVNDYEKSIGDLGSNFRSKLEQYVALCKNIKYSLLGNVKGEER